MRLRTAAVLAVGLSASIVVLAQAPRIDGKWEVTMEMDMPGMPMNMPPTVTTQCITREDASDPRKAISAGRGGRSGDDSSCKMAEYKIDGNKVTYTMKCEGATPMTITGERTYGDDSYRATQRIDIEGRGTMTMKAIGKRIGDCTK